MLLLFIYHKNMSFKRKMSKLRIQILSDFYLKSSYVCFTTILYQT